MDAAYLLPGGWGAYNAGLKTAVELRAGDVTGVRGALGRRESAGDR